MEGPILSQPSVSIIVAVYKSEQFLPKLLHSFEVQTHKNLQIILVDDGSPDDSGRICDDYATRDPRAIVIHKPNGGTCSARNAGLGVATGDYLMIVEVTTGWSPIALNIWSTWLRAPAPTCPTR